MNEKALPLLGDSPAQLAAFREYLAAFSAGDVDRFTAFYTDDIHFDLTVAPAFEGKAAVVVFYRRMFGRMREQITLERLEASAELIVVDIGIVFTAMQAVEDFPLGPMRAGDTVHGRFQVKYWLRDGLIAALRVTPAAGA